MITMATQTHLCWTFINSKVQNVHILGCFFSVFYVSLNFMASPSFLLCNRTEDKTRLVGVLK